MVTITALNQGFPVDPGVAPSTGYKQTPSTSGDFPGREMMIYNEDCSSFCKAVYGSASEAITAGNLCVFAEDFAATKVDPTNIGPVGVAVATMASGDYGWFIVEGQARILSEATAAGTRACVSASNAGYIDDADVGGDRIHGLFIVEAEVTTSGAYNENTSKCLLNRPYVDGVSEHGGVIVSTDAGTLALTAAAHGGRWVNFNDADGVITLPNATGTGVEFWVRIGTAATSMTITVTPSTDEEFEGGLNGVDDDADAAYAWKAEDNDDRISLNGTATGGKVGDWFHFVDIATGVWHVDGFITQSGGAEATPFDAAISS